MKNKIAIIGLGYVGLPLAVEFAKKYPTTGFDISESRIEGLKKGHDVTKEVSDKAIKSAVDSGLIITLNEEVLADSNVFIITVPTPVSVTNKPDFTPLIKSSEAVGKHLKHGTIVVYESTVYPGATEEVCIPILEKHSGLKWKQDFWVGYSPERINPGDKERTVTKIVKVVSGDTPATLDKVAEVYGSHHHRWGIQGQQHQGG